MNTARLLRLIVILIISLILASAEAGLAQDFPDVCQDPENILANCDFNNGLDRWQPFTEAGAAQFGVLQGGGECHAPLCPAAHIVTEDHFVGGLYQQVSVVKGTNYYANIVWLVFDSLANDAAIHGATGGIGRRVGIDPFGGTDSRSSNVVWSLDNWRNDCKICNIEHVTVTAQADTITVFLRLDDTWKMRAAEKGFPIPPSKDQFWLDDLGLKPVGGEAALTAVEAPTDTPTPVPPTDTPPPEPPTSTPLPSTDTPTPEPEPTTEIVVVAESAEPEPPAETPEASSEASGVEIEPESPVATPTEAAIGAPLPPPTLTPTLTPLPTSTPSARPSATPASIAAAASGPQRSNPEVEASQTSGLSVTLGAVGASVCIGGMVLLLVAAVMAGLVWLYRLGWGDVEDEDFDVETVSSEDLSGDFNQPITQD